MGDRTRKILITVGCVIVLAGVLGLLYPFVGSYINSLSQHRAVEGYRKEVNSLEDKEAEAFLEEAREYNRRLFARGESVKGLDEDEMEEYNGVLDMSVTGIMGYVEIPKINVFLPIYHGTEESVLQMGVGHLAGSSFPVGGRDTHAVLTGHSGLPASELFTRLDELQTGDTFTVTVLTDTMTYRIYDVSVQLPDEVELNFEEEKDWCTLITCTPIGVNTHRIVVRGERVEERSDE